MQPRVQSKNATAQASSMNGSDEVSTAQFRLDEMSFNVCLGTLARNWAHYEPFNFIHLLSSFN